MGGRRESSGARRSSAEHLDMVRIAGVVRGATQMPRTFHNVLHESLVTENLEDVFVSS
jgi:hypothetical protein